jgi:hypothetical protein
MFQLAVAPYPDGCAKPQEGKEDDEGNENERLIAYAFYHSAALVSLQSFSSTTPGIPRTARYLARFSFLPLCYTLQPFSGFRRYQSWR